jgi:diguanylate cyclase (GGDEF)-like protein
LVAGAAFENERLLEAGIRTMVSVPLLSGTDCYGSINVGHDKPGHYGKSDVERLRCLAVWIASHVRIFRQIDSLSVMATTDALTGVLNRRAFNDISNAMFQQWRRGHNDFALLLFDVDHFKQVNDTYGHGVGDTVLTNISSTIQSRKREEDVFARIGGEEFALLLSAVSLDQARELAEEYRHLVEVTPHHEPDLVITVSIGVATPSECDASFERLLSRTDAALYAAKVGGRNRTIRAAAP